MNQKTASLSTCLIVAFAISACFGFTQIPLSVPVFPKVAVRDDRDVSYRANYPIALWNYTDQRAFRDSIGYYKKEGNGRLRVSRTSMGVESWVSRALMRAARAQGLRIAVADRAAPLRLSLTVRDIGGSTAATGDSTAIGLATELWDGTGVLWRDTISGMKRRARSQQFLSDDFGQCLSNALSRAVDTVAQCLAAAVDSLQAAAPVKAPVFGGKFGAERIDSICGLDKSLYVISGSRGAQEIYDFLRRREYLFKECQKTSLSAEYPFIDGEMFVMLEIGRDGRVGYVEVAKSTIACRLYTEKVLGTLRGFRFKTIDTSEPTAVVYKVRPLELKIVTDELNKAGTVLKVGVFLAVITALTLLTVPVVIRNF
jgi:hypothetical protein